MADFAALNHLRIDRVHGGAIRLEIGERLRPWLEAELGPPPERLHALLQQLAACEQAHGSGRR